MNPQKPIPTVLQLVVDNVLLSYLNLHNFTDFSQCIDVAVRLGAWFGQLQEAARHDDAPRVLELLPWLMKDLDYLHLSGDLLAEWQEVANTVKRAAMGASINLLPSWVAEQQKQVQELGWKPAGNGPPKGVRIFVTKYPQTKPTPKKRDLYT